MIVHSLRRCILVFEPLSISLLEIVFLLQRTNTFFKKINTTQRWLQSLAMVQVWCRPGADPVDF